MNKNSVIGFVLIGIILMGFTWFQSKQYAKQAEAAAIEQARLDSIALVQWRADSLERVKIDSARIAAGDTLSEAEFLAQQAVAIYKDSLLEVAHSSEGELISLENDKMVVTFSTKGAQPYSVKLKDYKNYDGTETYLFKPGESSLEISLYAGENLNTSSFVFAVAQKTENSVVMRLPFSGGGYIEQSYTINDDYAVENNLSFVGLDNVIPRNVSSFDLDLNVMIPRMEKGYQNESRYSRVNYYVEGEKKPSTLGQGRNGSKKIQSSFSWFAFQQQFFSFIMRAPQNFSSGELVNVFMGEEDPDGNLMKSTASLRVDFKPGQNVSIPFEYYFGPNSFQGLKAYGQNYEKVIPLGGWLVGWFTRFVIIPLFNFLHKFISNFGLIILLMTIFIKIVVLPLAYKTYASSAKMQAVKPEIDKINEKYPKQEDAMKKQQATMDLYKRAGINPMGGCLPMLIQFPILWAMFRFFPASIELRQQHFLWAEDLSGFDTFINFGTRIPLIGDHLSLFALLMAVTMFFMSRMNSAQMSGNDPNAQSMRFMSLYIMPIMMFFICNNISSALSYYYLLSNLITILETWVIKKFFVNPEAIRAKLKETEGKKSSQPKSKWQQRLEEAQKMQRQMQEQKERQNKQGKR